MNAKRGYVPKDEANFSPSAVETMRTAARHMSYLIDEGYDPKQAATFVGNHFSLSDRQRLALGRSIATAGQLQCRKAKEKADAAGCEVWMDGFNTVITLEVMFSASPLFACMDGTVRDLAALRGTYGIIPETHEAIRMMLDSLEEMQVASVHILLDEPVSNSGRLKALIAQMGEGRPFALDIQLLKSVDKALWPKENVITSDSVILDHCVSWVNLTRRCVERHGAQTLQVWE